MVGYDLNDVELEDLIPVQRLCKPNGPVKRHQDATPSERVCQRELYGLPIGVCPTPLLSSATLDQGGWWFCCSETASVQPLCFAACRSPPPSPPLLCLSTAYPPPHRAKSTSLGCIQIPVCLNATTTHSTAIPVNPSLRFTVRIASLHCCSWNAGLLV